MAEEWTAGSPGPDRQSIETAGDGTIFAAEYKNPLNSALPLVFKLHPTSPFVHGTYVTRHRFVFYAQLGASAEVFSIRNYNNIGVADHVFPSPARIIGRKFPLSSVSYNTTALANSCTRRKEAPIQNQTNLLTLPMDCFQS